MPATSPIVPVSETLDGRVDDAVQVLRNGGVVAIPTDTVYGLAAAFDDDDAVERIFRIKGRAPSLAIPLLLNSADAVEQYVTKIPESFWALAVAFWPGQLTIVMRKSDLVSERLTAGRKTVGLRVPDHPLPRHLSNSLGRAITGTSANLSGRPSLTTAKEVEEQLGRAVELIVDGGATPGPISSTVIDLSGDSPTIIREGRITLEDIRRVIGAS